MITIPEPGALLAVVMVTHRCQLQCGYCELARDGADLPEDLVARVMADLDRLVPAERPLIFVWHGGEPLMRGLPFFRWIHATQAPMRARRHVRNVLQTNGLLLDEAFLDFLAETGDFRPNLSMDGPEAVTRATRGVGTGVYEALFRRLQARGIPFGLSVAASPTFARHRDEALAYFKALGIREVGLTPFQACRGDSGAHPDLFADILLGGDGEPTAFAEPLMQGLRGHLDGGPCRLSAYSGGCHRHVICVDAEGTLHPCLRGKWSGLWTYGRVADGGLDVWWATTAGPAPFRPRLPEACGPCEWKEGCQGGCPSNALAMNGGADQPDFYCASHRRLFEAFERRRMEALLDRVEAQRPPS